jgi:pyruvate dehydrogenase E1 component alpha subunit
MSEHGTNLRSPTTEPPPDEEPIRILETDGTVHPRAAVPDISEETLRSMYEDMRLARTFDRRAIALQRRGDLATYAPMTGQEGSQVATGYALEADDWLFPTYRDHAAKYVHGQRLESLLQPAAGSRAGYAIPEDVNVLPEYIPIATQIPHAVGMAWGQRLQGRPETAVLCHLGDGATSEGDFHEGLNFAGVFDVPAVFVCNNNQWAISTPTDRQTASETLAAKARAYGMEGVRVDGLDPLAVYQVTRAALAKARQPGPDERRPTLIESVQYRFGAHTTADDPSVYRDDGEVEEWREKDPIDRLERFLSDRGILDDERRDAIESRIEARVDAAVERVGEPDPDPARIFEHVYESTPDRLDEQRAELQALREKYGDDALVGGRQ